MTEAAGQRSPGSRVLQYAAMTAGALDGLAAVLLAVLSVWIWAAGREGMRGSTDPEGFATGMALGALAWMMVVAAVLLAGAAALCWRIQRRSTQTNRSRVLDTAIVLLALLPPLMTIALILSR